MSNDLQGRGLAEGLVGDGRALITFCGLCLALSGAFALFQSATGHFLPHDVAYLQMTPEQLCQINECRIVHFMIHDRVSFGGALIAIGVLYLWIAEFPLRAKARWAWWTLVASGSIGFGSFLTYLGYGYLDTWHGAATLVLLPCYLGGLWLTQATTKQDRDERNRMTIGERLRSLLTDACSRRTAAGVGQACLLLSALGMIGGGATIQVIGMTDVFVASDLEFIGLTRDRMTEVNPRLVPLIAHDRAGFGGAVATAGLMTFCVVWFNGISRSLWQALLLGGMAGWTTAVFVHQAIGYTDFVHLIPAVGGSLLFLAGLVLTYPQSRRVSMPVSLR